MSIYIALQYSFYIILYDCCIVFHNVKTHTIFLIRFWTFKQFSPYFPVFPYFKQCVCVWRTFCMLPLCSTCASQGWNVTELGHNYLKFQYILPHCPSKWHYQFLLPAEYESACFLYFHQYLMLSVLENIGYNQNYKFVPV